MLVARRERTRAIEYRIPRLSRVFTKKKNTRGFFYGRYVRRDRRGIDLRLFDAIASRFHDTCYEPVSRTVRTVNHTHPSTISVLETRARARRRRRRARRRGGALHPPARPRGRSGQKSRRRRDSNPARSARSCRRATPPCWFRSRAEARRRAPPQRRAPSGARRRLRCAAAVSVPGERRKLAMAANGRRARLFFLEASMPRNSDTTSAAALPSPHALRVSRINSAKTFTRPGRAGASAGTSPPAFGRAMAKTSSSVRRESSRWRAASKRRETLGAVGFSARRGAARRSPPRACLEANASRMWRRRAAEGRAGTWGGQRREGHPSSGCAKTNGGAYQSDHRLGGLVGGLAHVRHAARMRRLVYRGTATRARAISRRARTM